MLIYGRLLIDPAQPPTPGWLRIQGDRIVEMGDGSPPGRARPDVGGPDRIICPAFVDAHLHIPQFASVGADGLPLLEWLDRVIYPAERFFGAGAWPHLTRWAARRLVEEGTFGFAGFLSSHAEASRGAMGILQQTGLRAIVGRVQMDRGAPDDLTQEDRWRASQRPVPQPLPAPPEGDGLRRIEVSANPRFAPACSEELLAEIGWLRKERVHLFVQTHLSESPDEVSRVAELFPRDTHYAGVYRRAGLLGDRTLLAHCCHLSPEEWEVLSETRAVAVHCPTANVFLRAGLFDLDAARNHSVRIALGSDVAAGPDVAMPRVARAMIETAKVRAMTRARKPRRAAHIPTPAEAWTLITRGNADALQWRDAGRFEIGASADLLALRVPETWMDERLIGRLLYGWSSSLIESRVLAGRLVTPDTIADPAGPIPAGGRA